MRLPRLNYLICLMGTILVYGLCLSTTSAQISGLITNEKSEPLSYATISFDNGTRGTTSNLEGRYQLSVVPGFYSLTFQYLGYKSVTKEINYQGGVMEVNVTLPEESVQLSAVTITAEGEDPAYAVMRKVIANRDKNKKAIRNYIGDLYIKGMIQTKDVPESFLGQDIGDMEGILDSNRQGMIYLSESQSTVYYRQPESFKEVMIYSKTAGNDNGFTFNQYSGANFNFYNEHLTFDRTLISPLNDAAFSHYRFKLEGFFLDDKGRQINKISVIPKDDVRPLFYGTIYIVEDLWVLSSLDLAFSGKAIKNKFFKEIRIRQIMQFSESAKLWYTQNQIIDFDSDFFNFKFSGTFSYFFFDIDLNTEIPKNIFGAEIFTIEEDAMDQPLTYWDSIRPIPLTMDERKDYIKKDSLKELRESKPYLDSIDHKNNKIRLSSLLFGFSQNNTYSKRYLTVGSPLGQFRFNPVEGFGIGTRVNFRKYSKDDNRRFQIEGTIRYGFSDKEWKAKAVGSYRFSRKNLSFITFSGGREYFQFDEREAFSFGLNTWSSLFYKNNYARIFDKRFAEMGIQTELVNGLYGWVSFAHEKRMPLYNLTDYSFFNKEKAYLPNNPYNSNSSGGFSVHKANLLSINLRWRPGQKYLNYPRFKIRIFSEWPTISLQYKKAINSGDRFVSYDRLRLRIRDAYIDMKTFGYFTMNVEYGDFLKSDRVEYMDFFHFLSYQSTFTYFDRYLYGFKNMPFYTFSTAHRYGMAIIEHHFDGYILDRIPLLKDSGLSVVIGFGGLWKRQEDYFEWSLGLEGFSIGGIDFMRLDFVQSYTGEGHFDRGVKIGFTRFFNQVID